MAFASAINQSKCNMLPFMLLLYALIVLQVSDGQNGFNTFQPQTYQYNPSNYMPFQSPYYPYYGQQQFNPQQQYNPFAPLLNPNLPPSNNLSPQSLTTTTPKATAATTTTARTPIQKTQMPASDSCDCSSKSADSTVSSASKKKETLTENTIVESTASAIFSGTPLSHKSIFASINPSIELGVVDFTVPQLRGWGVTKAGRFAASNVIGYGVFFRIVAQCSICQNDPNFLFEKRYDNGTCGCSCCIPLYPETNIPCTYCSQIQPRTVVGYEAKLGEMCACYAWDIGWKPPRLDENWNSKCGPWPVDTGRRAAKKAMEAAGLKFIEPKLPPGEPIGVPALSSSHAVADVPQTPATEDELPAPGEISMSGTPARDENLDQNSDATNTKVAGRRQKDVAKPSKPTFGFNSHYF